MTRLVLLAVALLANPGPVRAETVVELTRGARGTLRTAFEGNELRDIPLRFIGTLRIFARNLP